MSASSYFSGFAIGLGVGLFWGRILGKPLPRDQDPDWRRSFTHENTKRPSGPPQPLVAQLIRYWTWEHDQIRQALIEGRTVRGNRSGGPITPKPEIVPKPQFPPPRRIREGFLP